MKHNLILLSFVSLLLFIVGCKDICESSCTGCVEINQQFYADYKCNAIFQSLNDTTINIEIIEIIDERDLNGSCEFSTGGTIFVTIRLSHGDNETTRIFTKPGCLGESIPTPGAQALEFLEFGSYKLFLLKVYPRSLLLNEIPIKKDYEFILYLSNN